MTRVLAGQRVLVLVTHCTTRTLLRSDVNHPATGPRSSSESLLTSCTRAAVSMATAPVPGLAAAGGCSDSRGSRSCPHSNYLHEKRSPKDKIHEKRVHWMLALLLILNRFGNSLVPQMLTGVDRHFPLPRIGAGGRDGRAGLNPLTPKP